eukprot:TRINITY_DN107113_c0_g1_i1.p1 TRINITY_DN107113_c0_g1~~TRINITY_DN107113_c0_g1_i1.p1  ORF type:complete len:102 (-),score=0.45 TRINITY_DN107113_c0_g1_i1:126-431(-)
MISSHTFSMMVTLASLHWRTKDATSYLFSNLHCDRQASDTASRYMLPNLAISKIRSSFARHFTHSAWIHRFLQSAGSRSFSSTLICRTLRSQRRQVLINNI